MSNSGLHLDKSTSIYTIGLCTHTHVHTHLTNFKKLEFQIKNSICDYIYISIINV